MYYYFPELPAVSRQMLILSNRFPMDYVLESLVTVANGISADLVTRIFKKVTANNGDVSYLPYKPSRSPLEVINAANYDEFTLIIYYHCL